MKAIFFNAEVKGSIVTLNGRLSNGYHFTVSYVNRDEIDISRLITFQVFAKRINTEIVESSVEELLSRWNRSRDFSVAFFTIIDGVEINQMTFTDIESHPFTIWSEVKDEIFGELPITDSWASKIEDYLSNLA